MRKLLKASVFASALLLALPASAAVEGYLRIEGLNGAAGLVELSKVTYGSGRPVVATPTGVGGERDDRHMIRIVRPSDQASRTLWQAGRFPRAIVYVLRADGTTYKSFRLTDVSISDFGTDNRAPAGAPERLTDRFTLVFANISSGPDATADGLAGR
jgi:hypothetical protein